MTLNQKMDSFFLWIENKSAKKNYPIYLTIILICISLFFAFPRYDLYNAAESWNVTMLKAKDLTNNLSHIPPESFMAKKVFRLTVPFIIKIFHLNRVGVLVVQFFIGFLFILFSYKITLRLLKDAVSATFFAAGIIFIYAGRTCFTEITYTFFDGWAYFFILMAMYNRNVIAVFLFATLAAWIDERGLIALPIIILFHQISNAKPEFGFKSLLALNKSSLAAIAAITGYAALRLYLSFKYNMHTPNEDANFNDFKRNIIHTSFGFGAYTFLEGFWFLVSIFALLSFYRKHYFLQILIAGQILASSIVAFFVTDITRSGSYLALLLFPLLAYLSQFINIRPFRYILAVCMFFCFVFPPMNYVAFGDFLFRIEKPFLWVLSSLLTGYIK